MISPPPQKEMSKQGQSCFPFLDFCDSSQAINGSGIRHTQQPETSVIHAGNRQERQQNHEGNEMKETEELLAAEMNKLSAQERAKALDDLHCVGEGLQETPEMIQQSLAEFDHLVQTSSTNRIYSVAVKQNRAYVEDFEFRLKFLRANLHDARQSVNQMMSFLQQKALYFGEDKVANDIRPGELSGEEIGLMSSGFFQIQEGRDRSGRVIVYNSVNRIPGHCTVETMIRVIYHVFYNMLISKPEVQSKGIILVYYDESKGWGSPIFPDLNFQMKTNKFGNTLPICISSFHICLRSSPGSLALHNRMLQLLLKALPQGARTRARLHYGSDLERQYQLRGYGIPVENFPVDKSGNIRPEVQNAWCQEYLLENGTFAIEQQQEAGQDDDNAADRTPIQGGIWETDVLLGRGRLVQYHLGNIQFREVLDEEVSRFEKLARNQRRPACVDLTNKLIANNGTRFLKENGNDVWVECGFEEVMNKVSQFFRTRRRKMKDEGKL
ncbi:unnamed protein product [Cylindrotheca closterium]|uniref:DUF6824 domain-containing protein n=1 Tax=Cylindrotheca closterium TaxID=2856 RepID=A0AAD2FKG8_9STRA|nr:unnamed protein product [Cylindrotheca closterium]